MTTNPYTVGQTVRLLDHPSGGNVPDILGRAGDQRTIVKLEGPYHVLLQGYQNRVHIEWLEAIQDQLTSEAPGRPEIDFGSSSRETARQYAATIYSSKMDAEHKGVLSDVVNGYVVDAYTLNAALTAALRGSLGRYKDAPGRKEFSRRVGYLAHITQAVLENHADQLPAYVAGQRSRALEEVRGELATASQTLDETSATLDRWRLLAQARGDQIVSTKETSRAEILRLMSLLEDRAAELAAEQEVAMALNETVKYALGQLAELGQDGANAAHQVFGFLDAHKVELN